MSARALRRGLVLGLLAAVAVAAAALSAGSGGGDGYTLYATFDQAGGLRQGFTVRIDGAPVGSVESLDLDDRDRVVAKLRVDGSAAPVGRGVRATVRAADLLGEKFVDLEPGDRRDPAPSGTRIPPQRTGLAVELDDVINTLDLPTRQALRAFLAENGRWFVGRDGDIAATLAALPGALDRSGALLREFATGNAALGRLVEESDRVLEGVARERAQLGRVVDGAAGTFSALGRRDAELQDAIRTAPGTLRAARTALASLQDAAVPLGPAARGLGETAPQLTATLEELPRFADAAAPTLRTIREVSPTLTRLGRQGAPVVRRVTPLSRQLATFADAFAPVSKTLDTGIGDILGVLEGWARATQGKDKGSHIFRFGLTISADTYSSLAALLKPPAARRTPARGDRPTSKRPPLTLPKLPLPQRPAGGHKPITVPVPELPVVGGAVDGVLNALGVDTGRDRQDAGSTPLLDLLLGH